MAEYERQQRKPESRAIANSETRSRQLKGFVDNRYSILGTLCKSFQSCSFDGKPVVQMYNLVPYRERQPCPYRSEGNNACFMDSPGTTIVGNRTNGHSEEQMIDFLYNGVSDVPEKPIVGKSTMVEKQQIANKYIEKEGKKKDIFTYYIPCNGVKYGSNFNCQALLSTVLTDDSNVNYIKNNL